MANYVLLLSSIICSCIHSYIIFQNIYKVSYYDIIHIYISLITSLVNHYYTNHYIKWLDRYTIFLSVLFDFNNYKNSQYIFILYLCILFYFLEKFKIYKKNIFHILSHTLGTLFHCLIIQYHLQ